MKNTSHVINTWWLAHGLHMAVWFVGVGVVDGDLDGFGIIFWLGLIALLFTIPAILVYRFSNRLIIESSLSPTSKFLLWLAVAPFITVSCVFVFMLFIFGIYLFKSQERLEMLLLGSPAVIGTLLAVLIRYRQFYKLNTEYTNNPELSDLPINGNTEKTNQP